MTTAIIFDMDGVLIDSQPLHYAIDMRVLNACGIPATLETVTPYTGLSNQIRWPQYKEAFALAPSTQMLIEMAEEAMRDIFNEAELAPIDGVRELLQGLNEMGLYCGVASASPLELVQLVLRRTGLAKYFSGITSVEEVAQSKPAPDIYLAAAAKVGLRPAQCIAIEDSPAGILSAKNAGFTCIAYKNPSTVGQVFDHADDVLEHFNDGLELVKRLLF